MDLVEEIYEATRPFPKEELYGLVGQLRKAGVSVPSNIAEGQGRRSANEFLHFLSIAYGSLREIETQVLISGRLGFLKKPKLDLLLRNCEKITLHFVCGPRSGHISSGRPFKAGIACRVLVVRRIATLEFQASLRDGHTR